VDRDYKEVHRNLEELATMNVVEFEENGNAKKPVTRFGNIEVKILWTPPSEARKRAHHRTTPTYFRPRNVLSTGKQNPRFRQKQTYQGHHTQWNY